MTKIEIIEYGLLCALITVAIAGFVKYQITSNEEMMMLLERLEK